MKKILILLALLLIVSAVQSQPIRYNGTTKMQPYADSIAFSVSGRWHSNGLLDVGQLEFDNTSFAYEYAIDLRNRNSGAGNKYWLYADAYTYWAESGQLSTKQLNLSPTTGTTPALDLNPYGTSSGNTATLAFRELVANGYNYIGFRAPNSIASNVLYTLPNADGNNGDVLTTDGAATLSWTAGGGSGGEANTASNLGTNTVGVYDSKSGVDLRFRGLYGVAEKTRITDQGDSIKITLPDTLLISRIGIMFEGAAESYLYSSGTGTLNASDDLVVGGNLSFSGISSTLAPTSSALDLGLTGTHFRSAYLDSIKSGVWRGTAIQTDKGGTGLTSIGSSNQVLGVNAGATAMEGKTITGTGGVQVSHTVGGIGISTDSSFVTITADSVKSETGHDLILASGNDLKIADLTNGYLRSANGIVESDAVPDTATGSLRSARADSVTGRVQPKVYAAYFYYDVVGDSMVVTILCNEIGTIAWTRNGSGNYSVSSSSLFIANKTMISAIGNMSTGNNTDGFALIISAQIVSASSINLQCVGSDTGVLTVIDVEAEGNLSASYVKIEVYP